jgi:hypothetical protein
MHGARMLLCTLAAAVGVGAWTAAALASPAQTPPPTAGSPSCNGLVVAFENQDSGPFGASGNPNSSAGPGYFLGSDSPAAIAGVREEFCG